MTLNFKLGSALKWTKPKVKFIQLEVQGYNDQDKSAKTENSKFNSAFF